MGGQIISRRYVEYLDKRGLNVKKRGRPVQLVFQVPSVGRLLAVLNVAWTPSDALRESDLRTAKSYRQALHRAYIGRLNPQLPMRNLAERIGASTRTIQRYNRDLRVRVTACIGRLQMAERALGCLPKCTRDIERNATAGYWLETADGARYPAWRHIGAKLLKEAGKVIWLCIRRPSRYSLGAETPAAVYAPIGAKEFLQLRAWRGETVEKPSLHERAAGMLRRAKERVAATRYQKLRLFLRHGSGAHRRRQDRRDHQRLLVRAGRGWSAGAASGSAGHRLSHAEGVRRGQSLPGAARYGG